MGVIEITLEDVMSFADPRKISPSVVLRALGRDGSLSEIKKHLETLAAEIMGQQQKDQQQEDHQQEDRLAWALDIINNLGREVSIARDDAASAALAMDKAAKSNAKVLSCVQDAISQAGEQVERAQREKAELQKQVEQMRAEMDQEKAKAMKELEVVKMRYELKIAALWDELDRQVGNLANLRAEAQQRTADY